MVSDLLGVDCSAIVLIGVASELVRNVWCEWGIGHRGFVLLVVWMVFMLLGVSELEFLW